MTGVGGIGFGDISPGDEIMHMTPAGIATSTVISNNGRFIKSSAGYLVWQGDLIALNGAWIVPHGAGKFSLVDE